MLVLMYILLFLPCDLFVIGDSQTSRLLSESNELIHKRRTNQNHFFTHQKRTCSVTVCG